MGLTFSFQLEAVQTEVQRDSVYTGLYLLFVYHLDLSSQPVQSPGRLRDRELRAAVPGFKLVGCFGYLILCARHAKT